MFLNSLFSHILIIAMKTANVELIKNADDLENALAYARNAERLECDQVIN